MNFELLKSDDDQQLVFGWASVAVKAQGDPVVDLEKDVILPDDLEKAVYDYVLNARHAGAEHKKIYKMTGRLVESIMFTKEKQSAMGIPQGIVPEGWWVGFKIEDPSIWKKVKSGQYQMFSIEGTGTREELE